MWIDQNVKDVFPPQRRYHPSWSWVVWFWSILYSHEKSPLCFALGDPLCMVLYIVHTHSFDLKVKGWLIFPLWMNTPLISAHCASFQWLFRSVYREASKQRGRRLQKCPIASPAFQTATQVGGEEKTKEGKRVKSKPTETQRERGRVWRCWGFAGALCSIYP